MGDRLDQLWCPTSAAYDETGAVLVADSFNHRIVRWAPGAREGTHIAGKPPGSSNFPKGILNYPTAMVVMNSGAVIIADKGNHRVLRWPLGASEGTVVAGGNGFGCGLNQVKNVEGLALDGAGNLLVSEAYNHRIMLWAPGTTQGKLLAGTTSPGDALNRFESPWGITIDNEGGLLVADSDNHRVVRWARGAWQGTVVAGGKGPGNRLDQLNMPQSVAVDDEGNMFIADRKNNRVLKWPRGASQGILVVGGEDHGGALDQLDVPIFVCVQRQCLPPSVLPEPKDRSNNVSAHGAADKPARARSWSQRRSTRDTRRPRSPIRGCGGGRAHRQRDRSPSWHPRESSRSPRR